MREAEVIVIGAGAAGLAAARALGAAGKRVLILEARERLGGRIYPLADEAFGYPAQGGAEFVHGDAPLTRAILVEAGATITHPVEWWQVFDGDPTVNEWVSPHDAMLEAAFKDMKEDMTVAAFLERYFSGEEHAALREFVRRRVESYDAADTQRASARALYEDMADDRASIAANIREGYGVLVEHLRCACESQGALIKLGEVVTAIAVQDGITVTTAAGESYHAPRAILTIPPPLWQEIRFTPLQPEKLAAALEVGWGSVVKILLGFKAKWWTGARERIFERMFFLFSNEVVPTWWTQYPEPATTLTGWVAGPAADRMQEKSEEEIVALAITSLAHIFKVSEEDLHEELVASRVFAWGTDRFAKGAYSYYTPESGKAIETMLTPVGEALFFAGEALYKGEETGAVGGTVEAALASGEAAAEALLRSR